MVKKIVLTGILALLFLSNLSEGAEWLYFIENERGDKYFIDMESIQQTSPHTVSLVKKIIRENSPAISSQVSDIEVDCQGSRIRSLQETTNYMSGKSKTVQKKGAFQKVTAEDIEESLIELICSLKKSGGS